MTARRLVLIGVIVFVLVVGYRATQLLTGGAGSVFQIGLIYDPDALGPLGLVREAYEAVLQEEGIPHEWVATGDFVLRHGRDTFARFRALIFPDGLAQKMPSWVVDRAKEYLEAGGSIAVVFDPGIKEPSGTYRSGGLLAGLTGVEYLRYAELRDRAYRQGGVRFDDSRDAAFWHVPSGKLYQGQVVGGYAYGGLVYPMAAAQAVARDLEVFATDEGVPVLTLRSFGKGKALWVNLPLGYLKAYSDDLPLRLALRTFVFDIVGLPHLVSAPHGVGGVVINWHIDSRIEMQGIPSLFKLGLVRRELKQEFHVTAGPDRDRPGDDLGFDACGRGETLVRELLPYGAVGSHGGWAHNAFAEGLAREQLSASEIESLIRKNNECLERITKTRVRSYSAPAGVHPQPVVTRVLEKLGIRAYYYTGDTGAPLNRTFFDGRMVSTSVWVFPVMPNGRYASIGEMGRAGLTARQVEEWLRETLDYAVRERTVRLVYSHPYDLLDPAYQEAFTRFLDHAELLQRQRLLRVETMEYFATFMDRFLKTKASFFRDGGDLVVRLENPEGLEGITAAVPANWVKMPLSIPSDLGHIEDQRGYHLFVVRSRNTRVAFRLPLDGSEVPPPK